MFYGNNNVSENVAARAQREDIIVRYDGARLVSLAYYRPGNGTMVIHIFFSFFINTSSIARPTFIVTSSSENTEAYLTLNLTLFTL